MVEVDTVETLWDMSIFYKTIHYYVAANRRHISYQVS